MPEVLCKASEMLCLLCRYGIFSMATSQNGPVYSEILRCVFVKTA
jgi:hypothetical protein